MSLRNSTASRLVAECPHCKGPLEVGITGVAVRSLGTSDAVRFRRDSSRRFAQYTEEQRDAYRDHAMRNGKELMRRAASLFRKAQRDPQSNRYATCPICSARTGSNVLYGHLQRAHAAQLMAMPATDFET